MNNENRNNKPKSKTVTSVFKLRNYFLETTLVKVKGGLRIVHTLLGHSSSDIGQFSMMTLIENDEIISHGNSQIREETKLIKHELKTIKEDYGGTEDTVSDVSKFF